VYIFTKICCLYVFMFVVADAVFCCCCCCCLLLYLCYYHDRYCLLFVVCWLLVACRLLVGQLVGLVGWLFCCYFLMLWVCYLFFVDFIMSVAVCLIFFFFDWLFLLWMCISCLPQILISSIHSVNVIYIDLLVIFYYVYVRLHFMLYIKQMHMLLCLNK